MMKSNVTLKSNIYINKTRKSADPDFIEHIQDYTILKRYYNPSTKMCTAPLTMLQKQLVDQGEPKCSKENGTKSWGVPIDSNRMALRCEEINCPLYPKCSAEPQFEKIYRSFEVISATASEQEQQVAKTSDARPSVNVQQKTLAAGVLESKQKSIPSPELSAAKPIETKPMVDTSQERSTVNPAKVEQSVNALKRMPTANFAETKRTAKTTQETPVVYPAETKQTVTPPLDTPVAKPTEATKTAKASQEVPAAYPTEAKQTANVPQKKLLVEPVETKKTLNPTQNTRITNLKTEQKDASTLTQDEIIHADMKSRIWVNAGPGTGKTYTVIKRLAKIFDSEDFDGTVLVLCFSKNAVSVIQSRLTNELGSRTDDLIDREHLVIRTFDSYATWALDDELPRGLDYDQRISLFLKKLPENPDLLQDVSYFIVDEVQDIVGLRAEMVKMMISYMKCGILILGDRCQAIYDWSVRSQGGYTSEDFFKWIKKQGFRNGELKGNHRQAEKLALIGNRMRKSLLFGDEEQQEQTLIECKQAFETISEDSLPKLLTRKSELVLCQTNGLVASISDLLYEGDNIPHYIMQSANHQSLAPWIGRILGGCTEDLISRDYFFTLARERAIEEADEKWEILRSLDSHTRSAVLHRKEVLRRLAKLDALPAICLNQPPVDGVVVSTVHRAKGGEANHVFWLDTPLVFSQQPEEGEKLDALKASYVAVTRARKDIRLVTTKNEYLKKLNSGRWIKTRSYWKYNRERKVCCSGIAMLPDDADPLSFVPNENAEDVQAMLFDLEPGMNLDLYPSKDEESFDIFFDGMQIGLTSKLFMQELFDGFRATNNNGNLPASIESVYISSMTTVIRPENEASENIYRKSGCWIGYELGGFAHINYT